MGRQLNEGFSCRGGIGILVLLRAMMARCWGRWSEKAVCAKPYERVERGDWGVWE